MALKMNMPAPGEMKDFEVPSDGSHPAVCVAVVELGTHTTTYQGGDPKTGPRVYLAFELTDDRKGDGTPFFLAKEMTFSLNEKANFREYAKALWGGKEPPAGTELNFRNLLGKPCILAVEHGKSKAGNAYATIRGAQPPLKGMKAAPPSVTPVFWEIESGQPVPDEEWLPWAFGKSLDQWLDQSEEMRRGELRDAADRVAQPAGANAAGNGGGKDDGADDIPWSIAPFLPWLGMAATLAGGLFA
jgi:hypothetical protein